MTHGLSKGAGRLRGIVIMLVALGLAWVAFAVTASLGSVRRDPSSALRMWPGNSLAAAALADQIVTEAGTVAPPPSARGHALASLGSQPGNPTAARVMGVLAEFAGDRPGLARWFAYSERYSRRDLGVQLAQIELAVERGQIAEALVHYDRALRVFAPQPGLIDVLVSASNLADVRQPLVAMLRRNPPWRQSYLIQLVEGGRASVDTIYTTLRAIRLDPRQAFDRRILGEAAGLLVSQQKVALARTLTGTGSNGTGTGVRNGGFEQGNPYPPLDWKFTDTVDLSGVVEQGVRDRGGNALFLYTHNDAAGVVAEQLLSLAPGRYMLSLTSGDSAATAVEAPATTIGCVGQSANLAMLALPTGKDVIRTFRTLVVVPAGCSTQRLAVAVRPSAEGGTTRPWIDDVAVSRQP